MVQSDVLLSRKFPRDNEAGPTPGGTNPCSPTRRERGAHASHGDTSLRNGYASAGVGTLDVSNSEAVAGQDATNPITLSFGSNYAFRRPIAAIAGADPNKVVPIIDELGATTLTSAVASEALAVVAGPTYGTVYRGVAYVTP